MTLAPLFAGAFIGIGLGIIFKYGGTTGGVDIIARLAHKYVGWSMGKTMFMFDAVVIVVSILTYLSYREGMYTLVAVLSVLKSLILCKKELIRQRSDYYLRENDEIAPKFYLKWSAEQPF